MRECKTSSAMHIRVARHGDSCVRACMRACVCITVCARARARVRVCVCACKHHGLSTQTKRGHCNGPARPMAEYKCSTANIWFLFVSTAVITIRKHIENML